MNKKYLLALLTLLPGIAQAMTLPGPMEQQLDDALTSTATQVLTVKAYDQVANANFENRLVGPAIDTATTSLALSGLVTTGAGGVMLLGVMSAGSANDDAASGQFSSAGIGLELAALVSLGIPSLLAPMKAEHLLNQGKLDGYARAVSQQFGKAFLLQPAQVSALESAIKGKVILAAAENQLDTVDIFRIIADATFEGKLLFSNEERSVLISLREIAHEGYSGSRDIATKLAQLKASQALLQAYLDKRGSSLGVSASRKLQAALDGNQKLFNEVKLYLQATTRSSPEDYRQNIERGGQ